MLILKKIMNSFIQKDALNLNLKNYSFFNSVDSNKISDVKIYKTILTSNEFADDNENIELLKVYLNSKRIVNLLNLFLRKYKWKKAIEYDVNCDLFLNDLDGFPDHQKIALLENNTKYKFRLSDLTNYWVICLTNSQNLFSRPLKLKNPHTNIEISDHNLINIYIKLLHSNFNIPLCVHAFYLSNMSIADFSYKYYGILKEKTIENFIYNGSYYEKYEQVLNMLHDYRKELNYTTVLNNIPYTERRSLIYNLKHIIPLYIRGKFSCNPLVKRDYTEITKKKIKEFFNENTNLGIHERYVIRYVPLSERTPRVSPPPPPPQAMSRRRRPSMPPPSPIQRRQLEIINEINLNSNHIVSENSNSTEETPQPVEQPVEESLEETAEESLEQTVVESVEEDAEESVEEAAEESSREAIQETEYDIMEEIPEEINIESEEDNYTYSDSSESIDIGLDRDSLYDENPHIERGNPFTPTRELNRTPPSALSRRQQQISSSFSIFR